tara:strand:+ start:603 stop:1739 length:1137 start_codon:yes stop_codon:yes gene_type:complete
MPGFEIIDSKESKAVSRLFKEENGILFAHGFDNLRKKYHVRELEQNFNKKLKSKYTLVLSSGTAAIKIALLALGIKRGDEVITQAFNFIATVEAILDIGAIPIIANIDNSLNIDPLEIESLITKKTKAIIPVHMLGVPADMDKIILIAKKYKLKVLEDNCEALGGKYKNKYLGTIGDVGVASLDFGKIITCGEGGTIHTNSNKIYKFAKEYHDHGHQNNPKKTRGTDTKKIYGFNYRMTEIQAVIGKEQLKKLNYIILENKRRYLAIDKILGKYLEKRIIPKGSDLIYDTYIFFIRNKSQKKQAIDLLNNLKFGTKNLPDAIEWHCTFYWNHAISKKNISHSKKSKDLLKTSIAIPIQLKKTINEYKNLAKELKKIFE